MGTLARFPAGSILLVAVSCRSALEGGPAPPPAPSADVGPARAERDHPAPALDVCTGSKPKAHEYDGVLRNARCDQDLYISMANMAGELGVGCRHCHVAVPGTADKEDYPPMTAPKRVANWMSTELMQSVKPADGSVIQCKSCHTDSAGQPVAKILGSPRDRVKAAEWMSLVLTKKFVAADGSRLRCSSCHVGPPGSPEFQKEVILRTDRLPKHATGGKGSPSF